MRRHHLRIIIVCSALLLLYGTVSAQSETSITSFKMPLPLDQLRPITVDTAAEVIELGWVRQYGPGHSQWMYDIALSPDGTTVAAEGLYGTIVVWDTRSGQAVTFIPHSLSVQAIALSSDNRLLAASEETWDDDLHQVVSNVQVWDIATSEKRIAMNTPGYVRSIAFNPDNNLLAVASEYPGELKIVDVLTGDIQNDLPLEEYGNAVAFSPDGSQLAVSTGWTVRVWNSDDYSEVFATQQDGGMSMAYSGDGQYIVTGIGNAKVSVLNAETGQVVARTTMYMDTEVVFGADDRLVVIVNGGKLWFWDTFNNCFTAVLESDSLIFSILRVNVAGSLLATSKSNGYGADVTLYGAPNCAIRATQRTNLRTGYGVNNPVGGALQQRDLGIVVGQRIDNAGFTWWKLTNDLWVRSDVVEIASGCHDVPEAD